MRTRHDPTPKDPKCRPWNARENERRRSQAGFAHAYAQSVEIELRAKSFRDAKTLRLQATA